MLDINNFFSALTRRWYIVVALVLGIALSSASAGPREKTQRAKVLLREALRIERQLARLKLSGSQISNLLVAHRLSDSDGDGVPDIYENSQSSLNSCNTDSNDDGIPDGDESSSSSSQSSSSSSGSSSSSSSSSGSSSSGSSSSSSSGSSSSDD